MDTPRLETISECVARALQVCDGIRSPEQVGARVIPEIGVPQERQLSNTLYNVAVQE